MSAYPPALRSALKAVPVLVMCLAASTFTWCYIHGLTRHSQDHVPKHAYRSTKFERLIRFRDDRIRFEYEPKLTANPNLLWFGTEIDMIDKSIWQNDHRPIESFMNRDRNKIKENYLIKVRELNSIILSEGQIANWAFSGFLCFQSFLLQALW